MCKSHELEEDELGPYGVRVRAWQRLSHAKQCCYTVTVYTFAVLTSRDTFSPVYINSMMMLIVV